MQQRPTAPSVLDRAVRHDRALMLLGLAAIAFLAWRYLIDMAAVMRMSAADKAMHAAMGMPEMAAWGTAEFVMLFLMWAVMMVAMMLPSAAPMILLVVGTYRRRGARSRLLTGTFLCGYLFAWTVFSAVAAVMQLILHRAAMLTPDMAAGSTMMGGSLLLLAGAYQWLPLKHSCLSHCRSPLAYLGMHWREGATGAFSMGLRHGLYCVGCCWALMLLLFAAGVMNLLWVAAIAIFVLVEKMASAGHLAGRAAGVALIAWGTWVMLAG